MSDKASIDRFIMALDGVLDFLRDHDLIQFDTVRAMSYCMEKIDAVSVRLSEVTLEIRNNMNPDGVEREAFTEAP